MAQFDSKHFNAEAFGKYLSRIPQVRKNALIKAGILTGNADIRAAFAGTAGLSYATTPFKGLISGTPLNYDGINNITANTTDTYSRSVQVIGRMAAWTEKDFSYDVTNKTDFMDNVAVQVSEYWDHQYQLLLLNILEGIFSMSGKTTAVEADTEFVTKHTYDISADSDPYVGATTLNSAISQACGDNKSIFTLAFMHSVVATNLENLRLLEYMKQTDADGIQRDLAIATWNGRTVIIDDEMPVDDTTGAYTSYILGRGAFDFEDIGAKVPQEMDRDPATNGGLDTLYTRKRVLFAPNGISYTKASQATESPTDDELVNAENWTLVNNGQSDDSYAAINHKSIPIARIISLG